MLEIGCGISMEGLSKSKKKVSQDRYCPAWDQNWAPPENECRVLSTRPNHIFLTGHKQIPFRFLLHLNWAHLSYLLFIFCGWNYKSWAGFSNSKAQLTQKLTSSCCGFAVTTKFADKFSYKAAKLACSSCVNMLLLVCLLGLSVVVTSGTPVTDKMTLVGIHLNWYF